MAALAAIVGLIFGSFLPATMNLWSPQLHPLEFDPNPSAYQCHRI
jgi:hypothetical protein